MSPRNRLLVLDGALVGSLLVVGLLTLGPTGAAGWAWGDPVAELHWYAGAASSPTAAAQLVGNLFLLVPTAVLAVLREPALRRPAALVPAAAAGMLIELLQWALPLGRVVSPVDALLNGVGALVVGGLTAVALTLRTAGSRRPHRVWGAA
ncbi:VanZ family protein [Modestobacter sp. VKM Ac-2985]|uniref:VanZ family protein n=1 Tax=Modestobacter sp. VKM Ac-2985 TaxID=3004139 RepID=UPI0022AB7FC0|nr:VanZ family protein [Modestobacter sp. VKM Ac-2985]MCZ2838264.1 VanZ family protein [Modestobacter sp. VKM Ac-2985]